MSGPGVAFTLENFSATMVPRGSKPPLCYVKTTEIERGRVLVSTDSLTKLFLDKMDHGTGQPQSGGSSKGKKAGDEKKSSISDVKVSTSGHDVVITGKVHKVVALPFEIRGPLDVADGRLLRIHVEKIKAAGLEVKGLLNMLGVHLTQMLSPETAKGVTVQENAILFDPDALAHVRGQIANAHVEGHDLVVDFAPHTVTAQSKPRNRR